jgi:hypothetical protein
LNDYNKQSHLARLVHAHSKLSTGYPLERQ